MIFFLVAAITVLAGYIVDRLKLRYRLQQMRERADEQAAMHRKGVPVDPRKFPLDGSNKTN